MLSEGQAVHQAEFKYQNLPKKKPHYWFIKISQNTVISECGKAGPIVGLLQNCS